MKTPVFEIFGAFIFNNRFRCNDSNWEQIYQILIENGYNVNNDNSSVLNMMSSIFDNEGVEYVQVDADADAGVGGKYMFAATNRQVIDGIIGNDITHEDKFNVYNVNDVNDLIQIVEIPDRAGEVVTSIVCRGNGTVEIPMLYKKNISGTVDILDGHLRFIFDVRLEVTGEMEILVFYSNIDNKENIHAIKINNVRIFKHNMISCETFGGRHLYALKYEV